MNMEMDMMLVLGIKLTMSVPHAICGLLTIHTYDMMGLCWLLRLG